MSSDAENEISSLTKKPNKRPMWYNKKFMKYVIYIAVIFVFCLVIYMTSKLWFRNEFIVIITINRKTTNATEVIIESDQPLVNNYFRIKMREEWSAASTNGNLRKLNSPATTVIIGQTNTQECHDFDSCKFQVLLMQQFFMKFRNFEDVGYNYLIGGDGAVYEGIGWDYIGYHTKGYNDNSIGIAFIGNYQYNEPTENQLSAAKLLIEFGLENNKLIENYELIGQRDVLPRLRSPGDALFTRIKMWKHYRN